MDRRTFLKAIGAGLTFPGVAVQALSAKPVQGAVGHKLLLFCDPHEILWDAETISDSNWHDLVGAGEYIKTDPTIWDLPNPGEFTIHFSFKPDDVSWIDAPF